MAKQEGLKRMVLKILAVPRAVTGVLTFQNHQDVHKYCKHVGPKASIMMIPDEARRSRRSRHGGSSGNRSTKSLEPTSPTVSCMGQIKNNKKHRQCIKRAKSKRITLPSNVHHARPLLSSLSEEVKNKKQPSTFQRIFRRRRSGRKSSFRASSEAHGLAAAAAPALSQMKSFASRRGALADFDWKAHVVVSPEDEDEEEDFETIISFSDPIVALAPKTEINLWKRRNMAPPPPLRSNPHQPAPI